MTSGDITQEYDNRVRQGMGRQPIAKFTLEIVVAQGTSEKTESIGWNMLLTDIYLEFPNLDPSANTAEFKILTERDNVVYATGELDASSNAYDYPVHLQRGLAGSEEAKIECSADISENKTFMVEFYGM